MNPPPTDEQRAPIIHGKNCQKEPHIGTGYMHDKDHDGPYDVDGVTYCGRCHFYLSPAEARTETPINHDSPTPETWAFMLRIDDSEIDLGQVESQLKTFERERNHAIADRMWLTKVVAALERQTMMDRECIERIRDVGMRAELERDDLREQLRNAQQDAEQYFADNVRIITERDALIAKLAAIAAAEGAKP